jgi:hypothetical protein
VEKSKTLKSTIKSSDDIGKAQGYTNASSIIIAFLLLPVERSERNRESDAIHMEVEQ